MGDILSGKPRIVVLSPSLKILHINRHAQFLVGSMASSIPEAQPQRDRTDALPPALIDLAGQILRELQSRHEMSEQGQFEIRHSVNGSGKPVFIRGLGVPNGQGVKQARIVILLTGTSANYSENHQIPGGMC